MKDLVAQLYPLRFTEILRNYSFGNRWIADTFEKTNLPVEHRLAETWEVCDRPGESSLLINGPFVGQTLHELISRDATAILGDEIVQHSGARFPLLIKLLDASFTLGEQAHHNDFLAHQRGLNDPGKTEAWVMLRTRPGAEIRCGQLNDSLTPYMLTDAILNGSVKELMRPYAVNPGDVFLLYAGTMHYSPGGVLFYEIMQNSDVYISLRPPSIELTQEDRLTGARESVEGVHLEPGYDCQTTPTKLDAAGNSRNFLLACGYFAVERLDLRHPYIIDCDGRHFFVLTQIEGDCHIQISNFLEHLKPGQSCLLPACLGPVTIRPSKPCSLLVGYVPDLNRDVINPLRRAGIPDESILGLGGHTRLNHLKLLMGM